MKEFDLEKAKNGAELCTRDGKDARIICFDKKDDKFGRNIVGLIKDKNRETIVPYKLNGRLFDECESSDDLLIKEKKREGWTNIYTLYLNDNGRCGSVIFETEKEALDNIKSDEYNKYVTTIKVEWVE